MPKVTEAHVEARKAQIIEAACMCVAQKGFHHTTMQDICQTAGLSPGAVYGYFSSKEDIIRALAEEGLRQQSTLFADLARAADVRDGLVRFAELVISLLEGATMEEGLAEGEAHRLKVVLWAEAMRSPEILELARQNYYRARETLEEVVRRGAERGQVRDGVDPRAVAQIVLSTIDGYVLQKALDPDLDSRRYLAVLQQLLDGGWWTMNRERNGDDHV